MLSSQKGRQIRAVLVTEIILLVLIVLLSYSFWTGVCDNSLSSCLGDNQLLSLPKFLLLAIVRPFVFTPISLLPVIAAENFGTVWGALINAGAAVLSGLVLFLIARLVGKKIVDPWLKRNLPDTHKMLRAQDYKIILFFRLLPFAHFDLCSLVCGLLTFRVKYFVIFTLIGVLPESFLIAHFAANHENFWLRAMLVLLVLSALLLIPALTYELLSRQKTLFRQLVAVYHELLAELRENNELIRRVGFSSQRPPILLLYGFFSSRNCLMIIERILTAKGYEVIGFNLGGLFGVFFTEGIVETAKLIDDKVQRLLDKHGISKIHVVAHSKGGLVALWWLLKMGGTNYCDKLITMGTPFKGSRLVYIALMTPFGFVWRDMWQMRPNSAFLKELHDSEVPAGLEVHCINSLSDNVASGDSGVFKPRTGQIRSVPMNHVRHLDFLNRRDVGDMISVILG